MTGNPKPSSSALSLADRVRAIAQEGLKYAKDPYDIARYESLLEMSAQTFADAVELDYSRLLGTFRKELGCMTPKLGADAAVTDAQGRLLVLKRADGTGWGLPGGWVDPGEGPAETAVREVFEEAGLKVEATGYICFTTKGPDKTQNIQHQVNTLVAARILSDPAAVQLSHEHTEYKWIDGPVDLPWHYGHDLHVARIFRRAQEKQAFLLPVE